MKTRQGKETNTQINMPGLLDTCKDLFGSDDLYEILGIKKESSQKEGNIVNAFICFR